MMRCSLAVVLAAAIAPLSTSFQDPVAPKSPDFERLLRSVSEKHRSVSNDMTMKLGEWAPFVIQTLKETEFAPYTSEQLLQLASYNLFDDLPMPDEDAGREAFVRMVEQRPLRDHWDAALKLRMTRQSAKLNERATLRELYRLVTTDDALRAFMQGPHRETYLSLFVYWIPASVVSETPERLQRLVSLLPSTWPDDWAVMAPALIDVVFTKDRLGSEVYGITRQRGLELIDRYLAKHPTGRTADYLAMSKRRLTSPGATGALIGAVPKQFTIEWSSDPKIRQLSNLKGRVVVLDFWATWCGPCIQSVPEIRKLQAEFEGYPVTILGVTSLQGAVHGVEKEKIVTKGDPQREYALTIKAAEKHGITWPTVFTQEEVFNPEFGNRGIPYSAILDPAGKVRFLGLHPGNDREKIRQHVIDLLKEFNLKHP